MVNRRHRTAPSPQRRLLQSLVPSRHIGTDRGTLSTLADDGPMGAVQRRAGSVAEQMQAEGEKDDIINRVHQDCVECRTSCTANVSSRNPGEQGIGEYNRIDVHCCKERGMYEERSCEAHVPI